MTEEQEKLYAIYDVNPEYAQDMTTHIAFAQILKNAVQQSASDIFVDSLVLLGYIIQNEDESMS